MLFGQHFVKNGFSMIDEFSNLLLSILLVFVSPQLNASEPINFIKQLPMKHQAEQKMDAGKGKERFNKKHPATRSFHSLSSDVFVQLHGKSYGTCY